MCWAAEGWLEVGGSSVAPPHLNSAIERSNNGAVDMFLTAGVVAAACEGLGSGKEESQSFPGSMALAFLE